MPTGAWSDGFILKPPAEDFKDNRPNERNPVSPHCSHRWVDRTSPAEGTLPNRSSTTASLPCCLCLSVMEGSCCADDAHQHSQSREPSPSLLCAPCLEPACSSLLLSIESNGVSCCLCILVHSVEQPSRPCSCCLPSDLFCLKSYCRGSSHPCRPRLVVLNSYLGR